MRINVVAPAFKVMQPFSTGVQSLMAHLTFGGHVIPIQI